MKNKIRLKLKFQWIENWTPMEFIILYDIANLAWAAVNRLPQKKLRELNIEGDMYVHKHMYILIITIRNRKWLWAFWRFSSFLLSLFTCYRHWEIIINFYFLLRVRVHHTATYILSFHKKKSVFHEIEKFAHGLIRDIDTLCSWAEISCMNYTWLEYEIRGAKEWLSLHVRPYIRMSVTNEIIGVW